MENIDIKSKNIRISSLVAGILCLIMGILNILRNINFFSDSLRFVAKDFIGGGMIFLVGCIFIYGYIQMKKENLDGFSFILVATLFVLILFVLYILILGVNLVEYYIIGNEDYSNWEDSIRLELFLCPLIVLIVLPHILKNKKFIQR